MNHLWIIVDEVETPGDLKRGLREDTQTKVDDEYLLMVSEVIKHENWRNQHPDVNFLLLCSVGMRDQIHIGPSDHVPWLEDRKWCYIRMEGTTFGDVPLNAELKLEVWDSPNSAGVITDAIRCLKLGLDRGLSGTLVAPSSYFMKSPPRQIHDDIARERVEAFIRGEDNETLVGTETAPVAKRRKMAATRAKQQVGAAR